MLAISHKFIGFTGVKQDVPAKKDDVSLLPKEKTVTIYGAWKDASTEKAREHFRQAYELGQVLGRNGYNIVTGGENGIMGATCDGAKDANPDTKCIGVDLDWGDGPSSPYPRLDKTYYFGQGDFNSRLAKMSELSRYAIAGPGGKGTLREVFQTLEETLDCNKGDRFKKIFLYPREQWQGLYDWMKENLLGRGYLTQKQLNGIELVDSPEQIIKEMQEDAKSINYTA